MNGWLFYATFMVSLNIGMFGVGLTGLPVPIWVQVMAVITMFTFKSVYEAEERRDE